MLCRLLGAYGAAATLGKTANVFEVASGLTTSWFILLLFLIVIALDNWTINVLNLYTGGLSLSNIFERLGRFWTTLIISVLGIILSAIPDVATGYTTYVGILGNVFSPIAGVLIADYLFVKRMRIDLVALFETKGPYWYWKGVNPIAVIWTALGFLAYMFVIPPEWIRCWSLCWRPAPAIGRRCSCCRPTPTGLPEHRTPASNASRSKISIGSSLCADALAQCG